LIAICGNPQGTLVKEANYFINCTVSQEACPNNLAPTTSTSAQLIMGDALAICLLQLKGFKTEDFARIHPGGSLGKQLYLKVMDLAAKNATPSIALSANIQEVILSISGNRLGATAVIDQNNLVGIITDGDLRRMMQKETNYQLLTAQNIMSANPITIESDVLAINALEKMRENHISQLIVVDHKTFKGFVHLHDLLREGLV
jgi:arabinose-5-phosphate isomerase